MVTTENAVQVVSIPCPICGTKIAKGSPRPNGALVRWMSIHDAHCDCGYSGSIEWTNPCFEAQLGQAVSAGEQQRSLYGKTGN